MKDQEIVVGLDIGTTKIVALVGRKNEHGKIELLGMGKSESLGVQRGMVMNIQQTVSSILSAIEEASRKSGVDIAEVTVGIAGQHIRSYQHRGIHTRKNFDDDISEDDIDELVKNMYKLAMPPGEEIIHVLPQEYIVDNNQGILNPVGMIGNRLEANFHIVTGQLNAIQNINKCVHRANLSVKNLILEPLASSEAVLHNEEKEAGVALVDIGGGTTDLAIFHDGLIRHTAVIPFGGNIITEDIKVGCSITHKYAEALKVQYGSAIVTEGSENKIITIPGLHGRAPKEISLKNLSSIINARMQEILEIVSYEIRNSGFKDKLSAGLVLTGGGALLRNSLQLTQYITALESRIGMPSEHISGNAAKELGSPIYSTGIGLMMMGFSKDSKTVEQNVEEAAQGAIVKGPTPNAKPNIFSKLRDLADGFFDSDERKL